VGKFLVFIVTAVCIYVLVIGQSHWKNRIQITSIEGKKIIEERLIMKEEEKEALLNNLKPKNNQTQSLIDFLRYRSLTMGDTKILTLGSDVTSGISDGNSFIKWQETLLRKIKLENKNLETLKIINHSYEGYSTTDLIHGNKLDLAIESQPDLIIFESMMLTNYNRAVSLEQTVQDLELIMSTLLKEIPNVQIIVIAQNPIANSNNLNLLGLSFEQYIEEAKEVMNKNNWLYIDSVDAFERKLKEKDILLVDILSSDNTHLNYEGYSIWVEILYEYLIN